MEMEEKGPASGHLINLLLKLLVYELNACKEKKQENYMKRVYKGTALSLIIFMMTMVAALPVSAMTLEQVKQRGELYCGISTEAPGFSKPDSTGNWHGLNIDFCRAVAAAVLGDATKVKFIPLTDKNHVTAILSGNVDLLSMNLGWNLSDDTLIGLDFSGISYYDGQGFMVPVDLGVQSALELNKVSICVEPPDRDPANLEAFFKTHNLEYRLVGPGKGESVVRTVKSGRCDVVSGDVTRLAALLMQFTSADRYIILPELISRRPLGPVVRQGDGGWFNIVRWVQFGLIIAEEKGVTSGIIDLMQDSEDPEIRRILGLENGTGKGLGLKDDWLYQMIKQVGNYGEIFDRNLGRQSELNMDRNINALWNRGGLHYGASLH